jgi:GNAT superfamily N-acetyltransferase
MRPDDDLALETVFAGLSERSRYQRFLVPMPRLVGSVRRALLDLSARHVAFVAEDSDRTPIGIARYVVTGPDEIEIALEVVDAWQRQGVGRMLLEHLVRAAAQADLHVVTGVIAHDNHAIVALARVTLRNVQVRACERTTCLSAAVA